MDNVIQEFQRLNLSRQGTPVAQYRQCRGYGKYDDMLGVIITTYLTLRLTKRTAEFLGNPKWITFKHHEDSGIFWVGLGVPEVEQQVFKLTGNPPLSFSCRYWLKKYIIPNQAVPGIENVVPEESSRKNYFLRYPVMYCGHVSDNYVVFKMGDYDILTDV